MTAETFEPKIIAFVCNWCTYLGADLAGTNRLEYPANVREFVEGKIQHLEKFYDRIVSMRAKTCARPS